MGKGAVDRIHRTHTPGFRRALTLLAMVVGLAGSLVGPAPGALGPAGTQGLQVPVAQAAQGNQGLQGGWAIDDSGQVAFVHSVSTQYPLLQEAGAGWVRVNFRLGACFSNWTSIGCNGKTAVQVYDEVVANAVRRNLRVLGLVSNESRHGDQSGWTANNAENVRKGTGDNAYVQGFAQNAAGVLANAYNGNRTYILDGTTYTLLVGSWEVWNEPNAWTSNPSPGVYTGSTFIYPSNFAWLLKRSYAAIKGANAAAVVISGGLFGHDVGGAAMTLREDGARRTVRKQGTYAPAAGAAPAAAPAGPCPNTTLSNVSGATYLCTTYQMGSSKAGWKKPYPLDHIGQHLYVDQGSTTSAAKFSTYLQDVRSAYLIYEGSTTPKQTHMTEFGWQTDFVSQAVQAQNLQTSYQTFRTTSYVARAYWFSVQDVPEGGVYFGLVDGDGAPKPAFSAFQTYAVY
jgi:hypothetical protein